MNRNNMNNPPWLIKSLLKVLAGRKSHYSYIGDIEEMYNEIALTKGVFKAKIWYYFQVLKFLTMYFYESVIWRTAMFKNYLKIAFRNILRHKGYSFINIAGLSVGMAVSILIFSYIRFETSYDRHHSKADRIYRVTLDADVGGRILNAATSNAPTAEHLVKDYPEVSNACRFWYNGRVTVNYKDILFEEESVFHADNSVFDIFDYEITKGDTRNPLVKPYTVVLTENIADKYFRDEDPVGKMIVIGGSREYLVTAVMKDIPVNSYNRFQMLISLETRNQRFPDQMKRWVPFMYHTYILLDEDADFKQFEAKLPDFVDRYMSDMLEAIGGSATFGLQPLKSIHLNSNLEGELAGNSDIRYIYLLSIIAVFIICLACINFMNLSTAKSSGRSREVGIRKVLGAEKKRLVSQFIGESVIYSLFSLLSALLLVKLAEPFFNSISGIELQLDYIMEPAFILSFICFAVFTGISAGSYPAFFLAAFKPVAVLKSKFAGGRENASFRNFLVGFQFVVSISLIIGSMVIYSQLNYMKKRNLGFSKEQILILPVRNLEMSSLESLKNEMMSFHGVLGAAGSSSIPGMDTNVDVFVPEGYSEANKHVMMAVRVDHDYLTTYGMELVQGRNFNQDTGTDLQNAVIINETAAARFGWDNAVGKEIKSFTNNELNEFQVQTVVGVVKDYHHYSLHKEIDPILIDYSFTEIGHVSFKLRPGMETESLVFLENKWKELYPDRPINSFFLDDSFNRQYRFDEQLGKLFFYFTLLAVFIACLGLFGLSSYNAEQRIKEIGIRKSLGAKVSGILYLLNRELLILITLANLISWPIAFILLDFWLSSFPYQAGIDVLTFLSAGALTLIVSFLTVSFQSIKASLMNPVDSLRYE